MAVYGVLEEVVGAMGQSGMRRLEAVELVVQQDLPPKTSASAVMLARHKLRGRARMSVLDFSSARHGDDEPEALSLATRGAVRYPRRWLLG